MVFKDQEKALKAFFEHDVTLAEEVRRDRSYIENKFNDIESAVKEQADRIIPIILTATTSMYQVFSHSVDIADLVMPKIDE